MATAATALAENDSPFWRFSLAIYARPEVARACLELQDTCEADVNLLLFLLWLSLDRRALPAEAIRDIDVRIREWREAVIAPLRALRRRLKQGTAIAADMTEPLRQQVKALELEAERLQQQALSALASALPCETAPSPAVAAQRNIAAYQAVSTRDFPAATVGVLVDALQGIDPGAFDDRQSPPPAH